MPQQRFQILSLSGGGYRGLYTAAVLAALERELGQPIGRCFELITGTSIGGIISIAAAFEVPMTKVVETFQKNGTALFPERPNKTAFHQLRNLINDYRKPPYSLETVRTVLHQLVDGNALLKDAKHPLLIPAVNLTEGRPQVFKTRHHANYVRDLHFRVVDVGLATSAAPTFFPPVSFGNCLYADGGIVANSPDLVGLHEATHFLGKPVSDVVMLSIGTTTTKYSVPEHPDNSYGIGFWVGKPWRRLQNTLIAAQQQFMQQLAQHNLGDRYIRIDTTPSAEQNRFLGLDVATPTATTTLVGLGEKAATDALGVQNVRDMLAHKAVNLLIGS